MGSDEQFWQDLLLKIDKGTVVPVIGRELMVVDTPQGPRSFHDVIADRLAENLIGISPLRAERCPTCGQIHPNQPDAKLGERHADVNDILCGAGGTPYFDGNPDNFGEEYLLPIVEELEDKYQVPVALQQLVEIPKFNFFVTTTFDTLLERTIQSQGLELTTLSRAPSYPNDKELGKLVQARADKTSDRIFMMYLFGRARAGETFAFSEAQILHHLHEFIATKNVTTRPVDLLREQDLLFIGVNFPDWLARFLIKAVRGSDKLWDRGKPVVKEFIVNSAPSSQGLETFLDLFMHRKSQTLKERMTSIEFIAELHKRWFARYPQKRAVSPAAPALPFTKARNVTVFLSYRKESDEHEKRVLDLALKLRNTGMIEPVLDQLMQKEAWNMGGPPGGGWNDWSYEQVEKCDKVLMICSPSYNRVFDHKEEPGEEQTGIGAAVEIQRIRSLITKAKGKNRKFRVVLLAEGDDRKLPDQISDYHIFRPYNRFEDLDDLITFITAPLPSD
jgi:hypothetical protein